MAIRAVVWEQKVYYAPHPWAWAWAVHPIVRCGGYGGAHPELTDDSGQELMVAVCLGKNNRPCIFFFQFIKDLL